MSFRLEKALSRVLFARSLSRRDTPDNNETCVIAGIEVAGLKANPG